VLFSSVDAASSVTVKPSVAAESSMETDPFSVDGAWMVIPSVELCPSAASGRSAHPEKRRDADKK